MAFLDNSGDIILDAVLTDLGRYLLAKGDGSFRVEKFALGDEEIDYSLYNSSDSRGSAYYDLEILNTPILEAFTDNASSVKTKLISNSRNDLLYLPVLKLYNLGDSQKTDLGVYCVAVDNDTTDLFNAQNTTGILYPSNNAFATKLRIEQGLDTANLPWSSPIDSDLNETQYIVEIDNRLGILTDLNDSDANVSYVDDDQMASYYFSANVNRQYVTTIGKTGPNDQNASVIAGPRGTALTLKVRSTIELQYGDFLFDQLGTSSSLTINGVTATFKYIDTNIRISGATTGYRIDIPVRFIKAV